MTTPKQALADLIRETEAAREKLDIEVSEAQDHMRLLQRRRADLLQEERVLRAMFVRKFGAADGDEDDLALTDHDSATSSEAAVVHYDFGPASNDWSQLPRTKAVEWAIKAMTEDQNVTVGPAVIEDFLHRHGRNDSRDDIGSATAHLNRTHRIHSLGRGKWIYGAGPETSKDAASTAVSFDSVPEPGEGGELDESNPASAQDHD